MIDEETQSFIDRYADALGVQRDLDLQGLDNARRNAYTNIMSNANSAGMMYSNFPERSKIQYDTNVYEPAKNKINSAYVTGLDTLRNNITDSLNTVAHYRDEIAALNKITASAGLPEGARLLNNAGDYMFEDENGIIQFRNAKGEPVRYGTTAKRTGFATNEDILKGLRLTLPDEDYNRILNAWYQARTNGLNDFAYNVGDDFVMPNFSWLDEADNDYLGSLGLTFK